MCAKYASLLKGEASKEREAARDLCAQPHYLVSLQRQTNEARLENEATADEKEKEKARQCKASEERRDERQRKKENERRRRCALFAHSLHAARRFSHSPVASNGSRRFMSARHKHAAGMQTQHSRAL